MYVGLCVKFPSFLSDAVKNSNSSTEFSINCEVSNVMKICPLGAHFLHADGQTDMTKPVVVFHNFANAPTYILMKVLRVLDGYSNEGCELHAKWLQ
jgi:hypothetical protein